MLIFDITKCAFFSLIFKTGKSSKLNEWHTRNIQWKTLFWLKKTLIHYICFKKHFRTLLLWYSFVFSFEHFISGVVNSPSWAFIWWHSICSQSLALCISNSNLPMVPKWTSSGPSAILNVLAAAHRWARTVSDDTPAAPCTWMAMSSTINPIFGAATYTPKPAIVMIWKKIIKSEVTVTED